MTLTFGVAGHGLDPKKRPNPKPFIKGGEPTITEIERYLNRKMISGMFTKGRPDGFIFMCYSGLDMFRKRFDNPARRSNLIASRITAVTGKLNQGSKRLQLDGSKDNKLVEIDEDGNANHSSNAPGDRYIEWNFVFKK